MTNDGNQGQHHSAGRLTSGEIRDTWRRLCEEAPAPLARWIPMPDASYTIAFPRILDISLGDPAVVTISLRPGQLPTDVADYAPRIAYAMGVAEVRVYETDDRGVLELEFLSRPSVLFGPNVPRLPHRPRNPTVDGPDGGPDDGPHDGQAA